MEPENQTEFLEKMFLTKNMQYENGKLIIFGRNAIMINMQLFVQLIKHFIDNEPGLLENLMYNSISAIEKDYRERQGSKENFLTMVKEVISVTGLGLLEIEVGKTNGIIHIKVNPLATAYVELYGLSANPICHLIKGAMKKVFEFVYDSEGDISENACIAQGKGECLLIFQKRSQ